METVTITDVEVAGPDDDIVLRELDRPQPHTTSSLHAIRFDGSALGRDRPVAFIEVRRGATVIDRARIGVARPAIAERFPDIRYAAKRSGFGFETSTLSLPRDFTLTLTAVLHGETHAPFATVRGTREPQPPAPPAGAEPEIAPLMVTTLGRTGGTWTTQLLASHPEIVTYPPFRNEIRVARYWTDVLLALSEPRSYRQSVAALIDRDDWWLGQPIRGEDGFHDEDVLRFLGGAQIDALMGFCRDRIEDFYRRFAPPHGAGRPRYFVEKREPSPRRQILALNAMFPGLREIFLVRDFRDMLSSILAYNEARGLHAFGRDPDDTDEQYVRRLGLSLNALATAYLERSDRAHLVRYEDLVARPAETLRGAFRYLGVDASEQRVEQALRDAAAASPEVQRLHATTASAEQSVGRWHTDLPPPLAEAAAEAFGEALRVFGYC